MADCHSVPSRDKECRTFLSDDRCRCSCLSPSSSSPPSIHLTHPSSRNRLVTTRFKLSEANEAFECLMKGKDQNGKLIMKLMVGDY